jgi:hypothetical protein
MNAGIEAIQAKITREGKIRRLKVKLKTGDFRFMELSSSAIYSLRCQINSKNFD